MSSTETGRAARPLTGAFWDAVDDGVLTRPVCHRCRHSFFTPRIACPRCQSAEWAYEPSSGRGRVYSHTTIHRPPDDRFAAPYVLAIVDLEEGWSMLSWIVDCAPEAVEIGMEVAVRFVPGPDGERLPAFAPVEADAA